MGERQTEGKEGGKEASNSSSRTTLGERASERTLSCGGDLTLTKVGQAYIDCTIFIAVGDQGVMGRNVIEERASELEA